MIRYDKFSLEERLNESEHPTVTSLQTRPGFRRPAALARHLWQSHEARNIRRLAGEGRRRGAQEVTVQLNPRYDGPALIDVDALVVDPSAVVVRQRDRLAGALSELPSEAWGAPSRCEGWSVQDVTEHLVSVNHFWLLSLGAGLRNEPTRFLAAFDPVAVPAAIVESARGAAPEATLEKLHTSNAQLAAVLSSLSVSDLAKPAEAPPGHIAIRAVCAHALWDAWIHERDVLLPLGRDQPIEPDEVTTALAYVAALAPAFYLLNAGRAPTGSLTVLASHPDSVFTVDVRDHVTVRPGALPDATAIVEGDAVDLVESLSSRGPLPPVVDDHRWLVDGLHRAFDTDG